jgi:hypothetical protein
MRRFRKSLFLFLCLSSQNLDAQDFRGWPNFDSVPDTVKNPKTAPKASRVQKEQITWLPWKDLGTYRYRTGRRYAGNGNWERYIVFQSRENLRISEISYGSVKASDVLLSPSNPVAQIVLASPSTSYWKWKASLTSPPKDTEHQ